MTEDPARHTHLFPFRLKRRGELVNELPTRNEERINTAGWTVERLGELDGLLHAERNQYLGFATERLIEAKKRVTGVPTTN